jgi:hypothetical protein
MTLAPIQAAIQNKGTSTGAMVELAPNTMAL